MEKKVSIIVPCYNMEKYIARFLDSIIIQKYKNIELIVVNDGSTDKSEEIIMKYKNKFKKFNINFLYILQDNSGVAAAINAGLAIFTGDYLTWADSDDFFSPNSIRKKVEFLEKNLEYGFVRSDANVFNEEDMAKPTTLLTDWCVPIGKDNHDHPERFKEELFDDLLLERNIYMTPGCYMIRTSAFLDAIPSRHIYAKRRGQNWQLLLPVAYKYKCGFIDEPLYNYIIHANSLSHTDTTLESFLFRFKEHEDILKNIIKTLDVDRKKYYKIIEEKYLNLKITYAGIYKDKRIAKKYYEKLKNKKYKLNDENQSIVSKINFSNKKNENSNFNFYISKMKRILFLAINDRHKLRLISCNHLKKYPLVYKMLKNIHSIFKKS